jgi:tRNA (cmo5U34)-methyltransferase
MGVATHLGITLTDYDSRIRTFIPHYEEMLDVAAAAIPRRARTIVDLGIGTGALSARCLKTARRARTVGIDVDPEILAVAQRRLGKPPSPSGFGGPPRSRATLIAGSFLRAPLPACDAVVASFSLHHVRTRSSKAALFRRIRAALRPRGLFLSVDCHPAIDPVVRRAQFDEWLTHLRRAYSPARATALLEAWSHEDVYVPLEAEIALMRAAGFRVELLWRRGAFAVIRAARSF